MSKTIIMIPADSVGGKLFLKDLRQDGDRMFLKYRSTYNDVPFTETEIWSDKSGNCIITGQDGTVLWRFPIALLANL